MKYIVITFISICLSSNYILAQELQWADSYGFKSYNYVNSVNYTQDGKILLSGLANDTISFGGDILTIPGERFNFLALLDNDGSHIWSRILDTSYYKNTTFVYTSLIEDDKILLSGTFRDTVILGDTLVENDKGIFLSTLNIDGEFLSSMNFGDSNPNGVFQVQIAEPISDIDGSMYVSGSLYNTGYFQTDTLFAVSGKLFLVKLDEFGNELWVRQFGRVGGGTCNAYDIALDNFGNVYVTGRTTSGIAVFGNDTITVPNNRTISYLTKFDSFGNFKWVTTGGATTDISTTQIISSSSGSSVLTNGDTVVYQTGYFSDEVQFGDSIFIDSCGSPYCPNFFLAAYEAESGVLKWLVQSSSETPASYGDDIAISPQGNIFVAGKYNQQINFDTFSVSTTLSGSTNRDLFIAEFNNNGTCKWLLNTDTYSFGPLIDYNCLNQTVTVSSDYRGQAGNLEPFGVVASSNQSMFTLSLEVADSCLQDIVAVKDIQGCFVKQPKLYPNPVTNSASIDFLDSGQNNSDYYLIRIINHMGIVVKEIETRSTKVKINFSDMKPGIYYVNGYNGEYKHAFRAIRVIKI